MPNGVFRMQNRNSYAIGFTALCLFFIVGASMAGGGRATTASNVVVTNTTANPVPVAVSNTVANPVHVSVGGGAEVTVLNGTTKPVATVQTGTSSVNVANTTASPVNVRTIGTTPISLSGDPAVHITNTPHTLNPAQDEITLWDQNASDIGFYQVPDGYNFVVDTISAECTATATTPYITITSEPSGLGQVLAQLWIPMALITDGGGYFSTMVTQQCHFVVSPNCWLIYSMAVPGSATVNGASLTVTGYLVPAYTPPTSHNPR